MLRRFALAVSASGLLLSVASDASGTGCRHEAGQVLIPAGVFWMGSDTSERSLASSLSSPETVAADWFSAEIPRHRAESEAFCIDRLLVTQGRYADFVARTRRPRLESLARTTPGRAFWSTTTPSGSRTYGYEDDLPLTGSITRWSW